ncbi:MAG: F0F1 ATP synthase subunit B [Planctomycetes bacterium]|nr:F0F1 ATP synthase subunit B [Planctomycetota bacterium]
MNPNKKRVLKILALVYVALVVLFFVYSGKTTDAEGGRERTLDVSLVGSELTQPLKLSSLQGKPATTEIANSLALAGIQVLATDDGPRATLNPAVIGHKLRDVELPAGTKITQDLWDNILKGELQAPIEGPAPVVHAKGQGQLISFDATLIMIMLNFGGLLVILYLLLWDPILKVLDDRAATIAGDLEQAAKKHEDAAALKNKYDEMLLGSKQERQELIAEGRREGQTERQRIVEAAQQESEKVIARTKQELEAAAEKVRRDLRTEIGGLSVELARKILGREVQPDDNRHLVDDFLSKLEKVDTKN